MDESLNQCLKTCSKESSIPYFALLYSAYNLFMSLLSHNDVNKKIEKLKKEAEKDTFDCSGVSCEKPMRFTASF